VTEQNAERLRPEVGLGLLVVRGDAILLGKRKGAHGEGEYGGPGGHLEKGEDPEVAVGREKDEEAGKGLIVKEVGFLCLTNVLRYMPEKHYLDVGFVATWVSGEPVVMEPENLEHWGWYPMDSPPSPLMDGMENYITAYKTGQTYFSAV
jgi:8-oxo-dGTP diphosphatase